MFLISSIKRIMRIPAIYHRKKRLDEYQKKRKKEDSEKQKKFSIKELISSDEVSKQKIIHLPEHHSNRLSKKTGAGEKLDLNH